MATRCCVRHHDIVSGFGPMPVSPPVPNGGIIDERFRPPDTGTSIPDMVTSLSGCDRRLNFRLCGAPDDDPRPCLFHFPIFLLTFPLHPHNQGLRDASHGAIGLRMTRGDFFIMLTLSSCIYCGFALRRGHLRFSPENLSAFCYLSVPVVTLLCFVSVIVPIALRQRD
jgi:hypothetical protein